MNVNSTIERMLGLVTNVRSVLAKSGTQANVQMFVNVLACVDILDSN